MDQKPEIHQKHQRKSLHYVLTGVLLTLLAVVVLGLVLFKPLERYVNYRMGVDMIFDMLAPELDPRLITEIQCEYYSSTLAGAEAEAETVTTDQETIRRVAALWNEVVSHRPTYILKDNSELPGKHLKLRIFYKEKELLCLKTAVRGDGLQAGRGPVSNNNVVNGPWELAIEDGPRWIILCWESSLETFNEVADLLGMGDLF